MLYSPNGFSRDQLLTDLIALKDRLNQGWLKGGFKQGGDVCIVAAAELVTDQPIGFTRYGMSKIEDPKVLRLGRMIYAVYVSLAGPKADRNLPLSSAMSYIASFNDSQHSSLEAVNLLIDRAIALALKPSASEGTADEADDPTDRQLVEQAGIGELVPA